MAKPLPSYPHTVQQADTPRKAQHTRLPLNLKNVCMAYPIQVQAIPDLDVNFAQADIWQPTTLALVAENFY